MAADPKSSVYLGHYLDRAKGTSGTELTYEGERHLLLFGPNGSGKGTRLLVPNLLRIEDRSIVVIDPKGELTAITADRRRKFGEVVVLNPFDVLGLGGSGFNPLASLDPALPTFVDDAAGLSEALVHINADEKEPHWSESARGLLTALIMWEVKLAKEERRAPSLERVRYLLTQPDEYERDDGGNRKQVAGLRITAGQMALDGGFEIESLIGRFLRDNDEIAGIKSTADRHTGWMLSPLMRASMAKNDIDFAALKDRPVTVYLILPAERMRTHNVWLRLVIVSALRALYRPGGLRTLFMLDEFAQLGHLSPIEEAFALVRGFGIQLWPVLQDLNQLKALYKDRWETFVGNAGVVQGFAPNDLTTAEWMSKRAGDTTVAAAGYNTGGSQSDEGRGSVSSGLSYGQSRRSLFLPQELMDFPAGAGLLWPVGTSKSVPFTAPSYWDIRGMKSLAAPNPYYGGANAVSPKPAGRKPAESRTAATAASPRNGAKTGTVSMKGTISAFNRANYTGVINGFDGRSYSFALNDWREASKPKRRAKVEFHIDGNEARDIYRDDRVSALVGQFPGPVTIEPSRIEYIKLHGGTIFYGLLAWGLMIGIQQVSALDHWYFSIPVFLLAIGSGAFAWFLLPAKKGAHLCLTLNSKGLLETLDDKIHPFEEWRPSLLGDFGKELSNVAENAKIRGGLSLKDFRRLLQRWCERALAENASLPNETLVSPAATARANAGGNSSEAAAARSA